MNNDKDRYVRLARRAADLSRHIEASIGADAAAVDEKLVRNLVDLRVYVVVLAHKELLPTAYTDPAGVGSGS